MDAVIVSEEAMDKLDEYYQEGCDVYKAFSRMKYEYKCKCGDLIYGDCQGDYERDDETRTMYVTYTYDSQLFVIDNETKLSHDVSTLTPKKNEDDEIIGFYNWVGTFFTCFEWMKL